MKITLSIFFLFLVGTIFAQTNVTFNIVGVNSWVCPTGVTSLQVEAWGGGAGGRTSANTNNHCGGGGGGGAYARRNSITVVPGTTYTFTVGAGGAANTAGTQSTATVNGVTITAVGGSAPGASGTPGTGGAGGTAAASVGDVKFSGGNGANGSNSGSNNGTGGGGGGGAGSTANGANGNLQTGGVATLNNGGIGGNGGVNANGSTAPAGGFGGGGGGAGHKNNSGGAGRPGGFILTYTCPTYVVTAGPNQTLAACANTTTLAGSAIPTGATGTWSVVIGSATITTPNSPTTGVTGLVLGANCVLRWTINNGACGDTFAEVTITTSVGPGCLGYCNPGNLSCAVNDRIHRVQFGILDNSSVGTCTATTGYSDYTNIPAPNIVIGTANNITITVGTGTGSHSAGVWIDFNQNGSLLDPGEFFSIAQGTILPSTATTVSIQIPTTANLGTTRMRVAYVFGTAILSSWTCFTNATFGETEDYTVNLVCGTTPSAVTGRFPANGLALPCGAATNLTWNDHTCATGFKVYLGTTNPPTNLVSDQSTTGYFTGNLASNTTYYWNIVPYSGGGDGTQGIWSFTTQTAISAAISQDTAGCGDGGLTLTANGALPDYYWYNVPVNGTPIATGPTFSPTGLTGPTIFYVSNVFQGPAASINASATNNTVCSSTAPGFGMFFDVQAKSANLTITDISAMFRSNGVNPAGGTSNRPVKVYYRPTSYIGYTGSAAGWTLLDNLSIPVLNTPTAPNNINITDLFVPAGMTYGFYIVYDCAIQVGANTYANTDIEVRTGAAVCGSEFGSVFSDFSFRGTVFYTTNCSSPTIPVVATPYISNNEVKLALNTVIAAEEQCTEAGWTYYADPLDPNKWLFAINKNGNNFTAEVDIIESPSVYSNINIPEKHGSFLISRYWNVRLLSGSIGTTVGVRFFFDTAEVRAAYNMRNFERTTNYPSTFEVPWSWFKSVGAPFNPAVGIDGNLFTFNHIVPMGVNNHTLVGAYYSGYINTVPYVEFSGITSFSGGTGGFGFSTYENVALPVELISFNGIEQNEFNHLFWSTASEINNDYFILESSSDGENFNDVTVIQGAVNSTQTNFYNFKDFNFKSPITYYRLKQVDYDGTSSYSNTIIINRTVSSSSMTITVFPNPTTGHLNVNTLSRFSANAEIKVMNMIGELIYFDKKYLEEGLNNSVFDFSSLARGIYSIEVKTDMERKVIQFVKQ
jgi:hypothetical protein